MDQLMGDDRLSRNLRSGSAGKSRASVSAAVPPNLRTWLDQLAARQRLVLARPGVDLRFEVAAIAQHFEGRQAVLFPKHGGHPVPVVSGIVAARAWIAET